MNLKQAAQLLSAELAKQKPKTFTSTWILHNIPCAYHFVRLNYRTVTGEIDWDAITRKLEREFQCRWVGRKRKGRSYESKEELDLILSRHRAKLYIFIAPQNRSDENLRDRITVRLVRLAQRGNILAMQEAKTLIRFAADEWIDKYWMLARWKFNSEALDEQIAACIRRYRFTGSFLGYLYKTLEYAGRGLAPIYSLDDPLCEGTYRTRAESVVQDPETGEIKMYEKGMFTFT